MYGYFYHRSIKCCIVSLACLYCIKGLSQYSALVNFQQIDPHTINSIGGTIYSNQMRIDWGLGEMASTFKINHTPSILLSTGYLQSSYDIVSLFNQLDSFGLHIKVGPNPFYNTLRIYCALDGLDIMAIQIFDSHGVVIKNIQGPFSGLQFEQTIQIQKLSTPICLVYIQYKIANLYSRQRIYKLIQY